jgi:pimeloyl-ACP methyl ester carboxylesterase
MWLDGPSSQGRVQGPARDLFTEMNAHALRQPDPGEREERASTWDRLGEISAPALVMVGTLDVQDVRAIDQLLADRLPGARFTWLEGVAHVPHLEAHRETIDLIEAFVDETPTET